MLKTLAVKVTLQYSERRVQLYILSSLQQSVISSKFHELVGIIHSC